VAGQVVLGKGAAPATPSSGNNTLYVEGSGSSFNLGIVKSLDASGVLAILSPGDRGNRIRNSGFLFAQRQAPGSATTYSSTAGRAISADGWGITNENASATYQRIDTLNATPDTGLQGRYYGQFLKTTSTGKLVATQVIEGTDTAALRGRVVRFQLWMKGTAGMNVRLGVIALGSAGTIDTPPATYISAFGAGGTDPTLGTNLTYVTPINTVQTDTGGAGVNGNAVDCVLTTAWQRFGHVFTVPSNCLNLIVSIWSNAQLTATNGFNLAQASLTDGYEIQDWMPQPIGLEFAKVCRFYQKSFAVDTAPAQNTGVATGEYHAIAGKAGAVANAGFGPGRMPVPMRIAPGLTLYNPAAANAQVRDLTAAVDHSATAVTDGAAGGQEFMVGSTGNASTAVGDRIAIHWSADSEI